MNESSKGKKMKIVKIFGPFPHVTFNRSDCVDRRQTIGAIPKKDVLGDTIER